MNRVTDFINSKGYPVNYGSDQAESKSISQQENHVWSISVHHAQDWQVVREVLADIEHVKCFSCE